MNDTKTIELPDALHSLFWDCDVHTLSWEKHRDFIISRILAEGAWESVQWLRATLSDNGLKHWLLEKKGANLDSRRLRFWELILGLEPETVNTWIKSTRASSWEGRTSR